MKITFLGLEDWQEKHIKEKLKKHRLEFLKEINNNNLKLIKDTEILCIFIYHKVDYELVSKLKNLKAIMTMSTGYDHINLNACSNIKVYNVPYYGENTVAEHTFALILALSRRIVEAVDRTREDDFRKNGLRGFDLKGKTIGVIGTGHIGQHVIRIAKSFDMNVIACSHTIDMKLEKKLGFKYVKLNELLNKSDIITLHCLLNEETRHIINLNNINKIKKGAYLINTARGPLIDTNALLYGLNNEIIAGAGLDVLEDEDEMMKDKHMHRNESLIVNEDHKILRKHNVIITPHIAYDTKEALMRITETTVDNINNFIKGKKKNCVN
ncbi:MAG: NAD(P)-dependent oxidoreductase [Nanoarchaeota archaeon]